MWNNKRIWSKWEWSEIHAHTHTHGEYVCLHGGMAMRVSLTANVCMERKIKMSIYRRKLNMHATSTRTHIHTQRHMHAVEWAIVDVYCGWVTFIAHKTAPVRKCKNVVLDDNGNNYGNEDNENIRIESDSCKGSLPKATTICPRSALRHGCKVESEQASKREKHTRRWTERRIFVEISEHEEMEMLYVCRAVTTEHNCIVVLFMPQLLNDYYE